MMRTRLDLVEKEAEEITVGEAVRRAGGLFSSRSESPRPDAQILMAEVLGRPRAWILAHPDERLSEQQTTEFDALIGELLNGAALPHVLGWWEFYGRRFQVEPQVLIPRPETELMVDHALRNALGAPKILDLGTGCGCIGITLALELPSAKIVASDLSRTALAVARRNAFMFGVQSRVALVNADLVDAFVGPFDLVCANLPYVATGRLPSLAVAKREPIMALDGGSMGIELIAESLRNLPRVLSPRGCAFFEIDTPQANAVLTLARESLPSARLRIETDLAGMGRLLVIERG